MKDNLLKGLSEDFKEVFPEWAGYATNLPEGDDYLLDKTSNERIDWLERECLKYSDDMNNERLCDLRNWFAATAQLMLEHVTAIERVIKSRQKD